MNKVEVSTNRKYLKESNRNDRAEEHNNWIEKFNNRLNQAEERIGKLNDRSLEII